MLEEDHVQNVPVGQCLACVDVDRVVQWEQSFPLQEQWMQSNKSEVVNTLERQVCKSRVQLAQSHGNNMKKE